MTDPRTLVLQILRRWSLPHDPPFLPERADPAWAALPPRDRAFGFDLLTGILRHRGTLDAIIATRLRQPIDSLDIAVRALLWLGGYQLLFQGTANYAAVDTAVTLAKRIAPKASGLVNAVLRGITRLEPRRLDTDKPLADRLSRRALAIDYTTDLTFSTDLFPDPAQRAAHLATVRSHPRAFVEHLLKIQPEHAANILLHNNQRPVISLRADSDQLDVPAAAGLVAHAQAPHFLIAGEGWNDLIEHLVNKGTLSPQDPTSAKPVRHLAAMVQQGTLPAPAGIIDYCAGLGTKTIQLARAFPTARITATDIDNEKLHRLHARAQALKIPNITTTPLNQLETPGPEIQNPLVLLDVPCSNTGVMAKRVQSRWRWPQLNHADLAALQLKLLEQAHALAPAATLVYSTCSIDPAENQERVRTFLAGHPSLKLLHEEATLPDSSLPGAPHDGGYFAVMR